MTDVNIAVELLLDAQDDKFDTAIIVSGDSDPNEADRSRTTALFEQASECCISAETRSFRSFKGNCNFIFHNWTQEVKRQSISRRNRNGEWFRA